MQSQPGRSISVPSQAARSAAPRYGVLIRDAEGGTEWSRPFPIPALPHRVAGTRRALVWLNQRGGRGTWELLPDRTVRYRLFLSADQLTNDAALMASLRAVLDAGNDHVHALVEVMAGREPARRMERCWNAPGTTL